MLQRFISPGTHRLERANELAEGELLTFAKEDDFGSLSVLIQPSFSASLSEMDQPRFRDKFEGVIAVARLCQPASWTDHALRRYPQRR